MSRPTRRYATSRARTAPGDLERGQESYRRRAWGEAHRLLSRADQATPLDAEALELLAMSAYLIGRDDEYLHSLERAHHAHLEADRYARAVRCAFWLGLRLLFRGETGRATGWLARAQRLLERETRECSERGYLLLPIAEQLLGAGDCEPAYAVATEAADIGERCRDPDLVACARHLQGRIRLQQGQVVAGLSLLDETMLAVVSDELSPLVTGLMYCSVIQACQGVYALDRAREWTVALTRWCEAQPEMIAFSGACRVHRAEIMQLGGAWPDAVLEAQRALDRCRGVDPQAAAAAFCQQAEVYRLTGDFEAAEAAYLSAGDLGVEPQPGLALLRCAQGRTEAAIAAIRRAVSATTDRAKRVRLLPAYVEILLAAADVPEARGACRELEAFAERLDTAVLGAMAAQARGAVELADGDAQAAIGPLRRAFDIWQRIGAPYAAARVRELVGTACRTLGDEDGARLELAAARRVFQQLSAGPDLARIDALLKETAQGDPPHRLTPRELQVLRLVASGKTNKAIAARLSLSERTVDRHVSNIFTKLDVSSRTAATAFAYEHQLI